MRSRMFMASVFTLALAVSAKAQDPRPAVDFVLGPGEGKAVPLKQGVSLANGGVIDVSQPNPTTLIITMSGLAATNASLVGTSIAHYQFDLAQEFGIRFNVAGVKGAKLTMEGRVTGLLRTNFEPYQRYHGKTKGCGNAATEPGAAMVTSEAKEIVSLTLPARTAAGCEDLSVYNHEGPRSIQIKPGQYMLHETWGFGTSHPGFFTRGAAAEFSPQPSYYPSAGNYWFQHFQPFNGTATKDFGFQVTLKLIPEFAPLKKVEPGPKNGN